MTKTLISKMITRSSNNIKNSILFIIGISFGMQCFAIPAPDWVLDLFEPHVIQEMPYRLMRPIDFDSNKKYPVIISLHGGGATGTGNKKQLGGGGLPEEWRRRAYPSYVIKPQSRGLWKASHLRKCQEVISQLPSVDLNRIYVMGSSMGGYGTLQFIQLDPDYFAAAIASASKGGDANKIRKDLPLWLIHGENDAKIDIGNSIRLFNKMKDLGKNCKFSTIHKYSHGTGKVILMMEVGKSDLAFDDDFKDISTITTLYTTDLVDREPNALDWMFSKTRSNPFGVPELVEESVEITYPLTNTEFYLGEDIPVDIEASDPEGVLRVGIFVNDIFQKNTSSQPYQYTLEGLRLSEGTYDISVRMVDNGGDNSLWSEPVTINVIDPEPAVELASPAHMSVFSRESGIVLSGAAEDPAGILRIGFYVDGQWVKNISEEPYTHTISGLSAGEHTIRARLVNGEGDNSLWSDPVTIIVENTTDYLSDIAPEKLTGEMRSNRSLLSGKISLSGNTYSKGISTFANSLITYNLDSAYSGIKGVVGLDDLFTGERTSVTVVLRADDVIIYDHVIKPADEALSFDLDLSAVKELKINTWKNGDDTGDFVNWADMQLVK